MKNRSIELFPQTLTMSLKRWSHSAFACLTLLTGAVHAQLSIDIIGGTEPKRPIVVAPFQNEHQDLSFSSLIRENLKRTGGFQSSTGAAPYPNDTTRIEFPEWKSRGTEALLTGGIYGRPNGMLEVRAHLYNIAQGRDLGVQSYIVRPSQLRLTAHKVSNWMYEQLTGHVGVFNTRVAYVLKRGNRFELQVAETDGFNPQTVLATHEPILSPRWSPDGSRLAYVSFELKKPIVYVHTLATGERKIVASFKGSNSAPAWFPDGKSLAVTLTKDGGSHIYRVFLNGNAPVQRLTESNAIDTEPDVAPDGSSLLFVSDRGGAPHIYMLDLKNGRVSRQTFEGSYNVSPHFSPDQKSFVFIRREAGRFGVSMQEIASRQIQHLTRGPADESPGFAPNGQFILYAAKQNRRDVLMAMTLSGTKHILRDVRGDLREPTWSPIPPR